MAGLLLSGPAGAGKSEAAREAFASAPIPALVVDFQAVYAALLLLNRDPETGRYPERQQIDAHVLQTAEYVRRAAITGAVASGLYVIATNSDGDEGRRSFLLSLLGFGAEEQIIDPGIDTVRLRLAGPDGRLSRQCEDAISRWYDRTG